MFNRLYTFLESNKCIYDLQFGFRQNYSTNYALLSMTQQIRYTIDKGNIAIGVFIDFQKAFDTVKSTMKFFYGNLNTMVFEESPTNGFHHILQRDSNMSQLMDQSLKLDMLNMEFPKAQF